MLLVWVQRSGVGTRELWVNGRTLWSVPLTLKAPNFCSWHPWMDFRITARAGKYSDHGTDRRDAPPSVHQIHRFPVPVGLTPFNYRPVRIQTRQWGKIASEDRNAWNGHEACEVSKPSPETPDEAVSFAFSQYGEIKEIQRQVWSKAYRYKVFSGVRIVVITVMKHIPSHIMIAGHRGLVSYEGQPTTCYGCGETGFAPRGEEWGSKRPRSPKYHGSTLR